MKTFINLEIHSPYMESALINPSKEDLEKENLFLREELNNLYKKNTILLNQLKFSIDKLNYLNSNS